MAVCSVPTLGVVGWECIWDIVRQAMPRRGEASQQAPVFKWDVISVGLAVILVRKYLREITVKVRDLAMQGTTIPRTDVCRIS